MFGSKAAKIDYKPMWQDYSTWQKEDEAWYETAKARTTAKLAASGRRKEDTEWKRQMGELDKQYEAKKTDLQSGPTYKMLEGKWRNSQRSRMAAIGKPFGFFSGSDPATFGEAGEVAPGGSVRDYLQEIVDAPGKAQGVRKSIGEIEQNTRSSNRFAGGEAATGGDFGTDMYGRSQSQYGMQSRPAAAQEALKEIGNIESETMPDFFNELYGDVQKPSSKKDDKRGGVGSGSTTEIGTIWV